MDRQPVVEIKNLKKFLGGHWVLNGVNLIINRGEILAIVGGSGSGKTTLLRQILMLDAPTSGTVKVFDIDVNHCNDVTADQIRQRWGMMFQHSALFGSLTVLENVAFPMHEHTTLNNSLINEIAMLKINLVGLPLDAAGKYPLELSGGMQKRAALARAIALDPELLFLDEPSAGLDPESANSFDELIVNLKKVLGLTIVMVTHDLDTLWSTTDRIAFLADGKVAAVEPIQELAKSEIPAIHNYFTGPRGRTASEAWKQN